MKKARWIGLVICLLLAGCSYKADRFKSSKNTEYVAMLSDPDIRKTFRSMKAIAVNANTYTQNGRVYFSEADTQKLNALSSQIVNRLKYDYHLTAGHYKIHTFIGKNQPKSCYQYYNSYSTHVIGKACAEFPSSFGNCNTCNAYINSLHKRRFSMIHAEWWGSDKTMDLVDTFKLKNGDSVYMGLEVSVN